MSQDLNLLPSGAKFQANRIRLKKLSIRFMIGVGILWVVIVGGVMGVWWGAQAMVNSATARYQKSLADYKAMSSEVVTSQVLKYRAKIIGGVLASRYEYGKTLTRINGLFPAQVSLDNYTLERSKNITLDGKVSGLKSGEIIENTVRSINNGEVEGFNKATLNDLKYQSGDWKFKMEVEINDK